MSNVDWSPRSPVRPASLVLLREADVCSILNDRLTGCREFGRTRGVRYQIPAVLGCKRLPKCLTHTVYLADPRQWRRPPDFQRERSGLGHSVVPHMTV